MLYAFYYSVKLTLTQPSVKNDGTVYTLTIQLKYSNINRKLINQIRNKETRRGTMSNNPMTQKLNKFRRRLDISTSQFSICQDISRIKSTSNCVVLNKTNYKQNDMGHYDTVEVLVRQLKAKDNELQNCIEEIVKRQKQYEAELLQIDVEYDKEINKLHEMLSQQIHKNKELQEKINVLKALGLQNSQDSSLLLGDL